jgi:hypothetical protein
MKDLSPDSVQAHVLLPTSLERALPGPLAALLCAIVLAAGCGDSAPRVRDGSADATTDRAATDSGGALPDAAASDATDAARADAADAAPADAPTDSTPDAAVDLAPDGAADLAPDQAADGAADVAADAGADNRADGGAAEAGDAEPLCTGAGCPSAVAAGHLQLWLRGDQAVQCAPVAALNRVTVWGDLSGHGRDAKPPAGKPGPLCGASAATINGRAVIKFARTGSAADGDYLEADLQSLVDKPFTIAVVERRPADPMQNVFNAWMIGSALQKPEDTMCAGVNMNANRGILLGYQLPTLMIAGTWGIDCDISAFGGEGMAKVARSMLTFAPGVGLTLFSGGTKTGPVASQGLKLLVQAYVGRGYNFDETENRFLGDIAEVVAFDVALSDAERLALDGYLKQLWGGDP